MLWEIDLHPRAGLPDLDADGVAADVIALRLAQKVRVASSRGYLVQGPELSPERIERLARELFADTVAEEYLVGQVSDAKLAAAPERIAAGEGTQLVQVLLKPGVMDPVAQSAEAGVRDFGWEVDAVRTLRKYWIADATAEEVRAISSELLANDAIEQVIVGPLPFDRLQSGSAYKFELKTVAIRDLDAAGLVRLSKEGQLYLQPAEMETIQRYFVELGREPTDIELETVAQTWSEHCSHKTLAGRIAYRDEDGDRQFENMLKETIFAATQELRRRWGKNDWCVSVFKDNAGIVKFDDQFNVAFKVETHNHPSALEPYGGANTGIGGVIRDTIGTGLGAKPICNTDVFCFAPPDTAVEDLPTGVLHPKLVMRGVVEGVRDYGNRMGIPTVNGAVYFDRRYLGNPLVYCGNVGLIPCDKSFKEPQPGDLIVAVGGKTGRDGIHGATFSSAELTHESESLSGGAVQIGNAIEEKKVLDVLLEARDRNLFTAMTDCGAGGFSSAVGEMGEKIGAEVHLDKAPVKYAGLSYTELWISEAQERMVLSVPEANWAELHQLCASEGVEATAIGTFEPTGRLVLKYNGNVVGDMPMAFLHDGRPPVVRQASYTSKPVAPLSTTNTMSVADSLQAILGSLNVASKESIIRQYDHEVQGGSAIKPLVGVQCDGPGDAAVVRPVLGSRRGVVISCGMNPRYGDFDPYHMAASAIDEALRNCVAVGADPARIAILDNFCWGDCERSETLGALVRAAIACHDLSLIFETPFISGKDSLNNEFSYFDDAGQKQTIAIPSSLLISAMGQVADVAQCVTMDLKRAGNLLYLVGETKDELGGSHYTLVNNLDGGAVPTVDGLRAKATFAAVHRAIGDGSIVSCHDLSEGGLAAAAAEMAFAGGLGVEVQLDGVPTGTASLSPVVKLFSESNSRFLCEVAPEHAAVFEGQFASLPVAQVGVVVESPLVTIKAGVETLVNVANDQLKESWQSPLRY
ncbi:phosphoribosylformylglycinamidine synthase subunit PurL [Lacipirellula parvula]|uniref:Phosphoribosylformylglycinamidine synthase subunit PurL n=1 Tax=Lacipirellula parvula TaxID=2650471 RepID=A0A5K7XE22_9BACT|nr:phosphoribosylformylglycinamidine synthase subunit PurL [Lacipirellula parvula]BBO31269.1 phosphoribosylformylglycinamidine synthase [Lacipirellula parvula]